MWVSSRTRQELGQAAVSLLSDRKMNTAAAGGHVTAADGCHAALHNLTASQPADSKLSLPQASQE